jgi:ribosomal protein S12 methylthiotransferase accessory factor
LVKNITREDIGVSTFVASSSEWISQNYGIFAKGYGAHPDAEIALIRALTEVSQTRAANIQGARDDLLKINYNEVDTIHSRKWQFMRSTASSNNKSATDLLRFSEIKSYTNEDILCDINLILHRLKKCNLKSSIVVDLTNPLVGIPVVRVIVPGLETFHVTSTFIGRRAMESYRKHNF